MDTHETYVSLETAKLLKKAGFDWECSGHWVETNKDNKDALLVLPSEPCLYGPNLVDEDLSMYMICVKDYNAVEDEIGFQFYYSAPTLALAQKWLREVKHISAEAAFVEPGKWGSYALLDINKDTYEERTLWDRAFDHETYENALEYALEKCLTILLEEKKDE